MKKNYIDINKKVSDEDLRSINQVEVDLSKLSDYYNEKNNDIEKIVIYKHPSINVLNINDKFEIKTI